MNDPNSDFADKLIYAETSFVIDLFGPIQDPVRQTESRNFSTYLAAIGSVMVTSPKVHEEVRTGITSSHIMSKKAYRTQPQKEVIRNNPGIVLQAKVIAKSAIEALNKDQNFLHMGIEDFDAEYLENYIDPFFGKDDLLYYDAFHYGFAKQQEITNIASCDSDFLTINDPNIHILTDTATYLKMLLAQGLPLPQQLLDQYLNECTRHCAGPKKEINDYVLNFQQIASSSP